MTHAKPEPWWDAKMTFVADGETDTFARRIQAPTADAATAILISIAEGEFGGDWDDITAIDATLAA